MRHWVKSGVAKNRLLFLSYEWREGRMERWREGRMERWMDGWIDRWMDEWIKGEGGRNGWMSRWIDVNG